MTDFRCTYRLQLTEDFDFRAAREIAVPYVAELGASHLYLSPSLQGAAARRTARRRRRPHLRAPGRRGRVPLALRRGGEAGLGVLLTSSRTHGDLGEEPVLARPGAAREVLRLGSRQRLVPPILRRRRPRRRAGRGRGGVRDDAREGARARPRRPDRRASHRSPRRARDSARVPRAAARARRAPRLGREDPRAGRASARLARRGDDGLRVRQRRHRPLRRPRRRGADDRAVRRVHGRVALVRGDRARGEARGRADDVRGGVRAPPFPLPARRAGRGGGLAPRLPDVRRAGERPRRRGRPSCLRAAAGGSAGVVLLEGDRSHRSSIEFVVRWHGRTGPLCSQRASRTPRSTATRLTR